jgi:aminoglycoside 2''-phosphotransferase
MTKPISTELYTKAIVEAFPHIEIKNIELDRSGWDNIVVVVNHEIIFRFPRRPEVAQTLEIESRLLPELRKVVSLPIPNFEFVTPYFVGYRMIPGEPFAKALFEQCCSPELAQHLAHQLAQFLAELHSFPVERARELGVPYIPDRELWESFYSEIRQHVFPLLTAQERRWAQQLFETFLSDERNFQFTPVLLHGDFSPDHILFDREAKRITGVIDFGDVRIGDPAYEFQWRRDYGEAFWRKVLAHYERSLSLISVHNKLEINEGFFRRLEFYERRQPLGEILYGVICHAPEHIESGLQDLRREMRTLRMRDAYMG